MSQTYWNGGEPCEARKVRVVVADDPETRLYWARPYVGRHRDAVEVKYLGQTFYLDDECHIETNTEALALLKRAGIEEQPGYCGWAWDKVTKGQGSPGLGHRSLKISEVVRER